jgi:hypothetical protein
MKHNGSGTAQFAVSRFFSVFHKQVTTVSGVGNIGVNFRVVTTIVSAGGILRNAVTKDKEEVQPKKRGD